MNTSTRHSGQVRSLVRALSILQHIAESPDGLTLTEISESAGLPPSTTHRLLTTLEAERFVRPDPQGGQWRIGVAAFFVGAAFARSRNVLSLVRPYLRRVMEVSGETANLFVASDDEAVCIGQIESRHPMRAITGVGGRVLLHSSAAGKALLAHLEDPERSEMLPDPLTRITDSTITDAGVLSAAFDEIRDKGYAIDDEEHAVGLRCVAAPIFNELGDAVAAISVSGPTARIPDERLAVLGNLVADVAQEATRDFGGGNITSWSGS